MQSADILNKVAVVLKMAQGALNALHNKCTLGLVVEANHSRDHRACGERCNKIILINRSGKILVQ
jgi:hypothetical protein